MGQALSALWASLFPAGQEYKIVMVGLDNAGKTTCLYFMHLGEAVKTQATIGSNVETVQHNNLTFDVWDLGGQANLRSSWSLYYGSADAVILVVDSTDRARVSLAKAELLTLLQNEALASACICVFANKQDLADAMPAAELSERLDLISIKTHSWAIHATCGVTGQGLKEGMEWISEAVKRRRQGGG